MFSGDVEDGKDEQHDDSIEDNLSNSGVINLIFFYSNQAVDPNQSRNTSAVRTLLPMYNVYSKS